MQITTNLDQGLGQAQRSGGGISLPSDQNPQEVPGNNPAPYTV